MRQSSKKAKEKVEVAVKPKPKKNKEKRRVSTLPDGSEDELAITALVSRVEDLVLAIFKCFVLIRFSRRSNLCLKKIACPSKIKYLCSYLLTKL